MNESELAKHIGSLNLHPHQSMFAIEVLQSETPALFSLTSPPGSGATTTAFGIVNAGISCQMLRRVLYLSSFKALTMFAASRLREMSLNVPVVEVDRDFLIERESLNDKDFWPEHGIFVSSIADAERSRFESRFLLCHWDLVIIDEESNATFDGPNKRLLQKLSDAEPARLVVLGRNPNREELRNRLQESENSTFAKRRITRISWYQDKPKENRLTAETRGEVHWEIREYSLTQEEKEFFEILKTIVSEIDSHTTSKVRMSETILKRAMSCLFSLENTLLRLDGKIEDHIPLSPSIGAIAGDYRPTKHFFVPCLEKLDEISVDSKSNALVELLLEKDGKKVCVISQFADTIKFLDARMQEVYGPAPLTLYAELTSEEIEQRIHTLKTANPQLILTTDAALRGIELSPDIVVHYDIPYRPELLELRIARFRRPGIANPVRMVALVEEASVLKNLWVKQLEIARALDE